MGSRKISGGRTHGGKIQGLSNMPGIKATDSFRNRSVQDAILIGLGSGVVTGVEVPFGLDDPMDNDVFGEQAVEPGEKGFRRKARFAMKMSYLAQCMNTGVGSSGADDGDRLAGHFPNDFFDLALDGRARFLSLPSMVGRAVILDEKLEVQHLR